MRKAALLTAVLATLLQASSARAEAPAGPGSRGGLMDNQVSVWGILSYYYSAGTGFGLGARFQKTVLPQGVLGLDTVRDDVGVEAGLDYFHYSWDYFGYGWSYDEIAPVVGVLWNFHLSDKIVVYPKLDAGFGIGRWSSDFAGSEPDTGGGFFFQGAAGAVYRAGNFLLRGEVGSGQLKLGAAFTF